MRPAGDQVMQSVSNWFRNMAPVCVQRRRGVGLEISSALSRSGARYLLVLLACLGSLGSAARLFLLSACPLIKRI